MDFSVIIPAYNEVTTIGPCLVRVAAALPETKKEIVIVDDGSTDGTREWLRANVDELDAGNCALALDDSGKLTVIDASAGWVLHYARRYDQARVPRS